MGGELPTMRLRHFVDQAVCAQPRQPARHPRRLAAGLLRAGRTRAGQPRGEVPVAKAVEEAFSGGAGRQQAAVFAREHVQAAVTPAVADRRLSQRVGGFGRRQAVEVALVGARRKPLAHGKQLSRR